MLGFGSLVDKLAEVLSTNHRARSLGLLSTNHRAGSPGLLTERLQQNQSKCTITFDIQLKILEFLLQCTLNLVWNCARAFKSTFLVYRLNDKVVACGLLFAPILSGSCLRLMTPPMQGLSWYKSLNAQKLFCFPLTW